MKCRRCNITMVDGIGIKATRISYPDIDKMVTWHEGGPAILIPVMKCPRCGHSVTTNKEDDEQQDNLTRP